MAVLAVPRPLQERLGDAATDSLLGMFRQVETERAQQREAQKEQLFELLEERFLRHVAESENRLRKEMGESENRLRAEMNDGFSRQQEQITRQQEQIAGLGTEIQKVRADLGTQIGDIHKQIGEVHKQIARQTRWTLTVLGGAALLFPIIQRVMAALLP